MFEVKWNQALHDIVTLNELWFYPTTDHKFIYLVHEEKIRKFECYVMKSKDIHLHN
jgi:hypothetical protein